MTPVLETAAHECVSEDALVHLKSYKYQSVDKSFLSHYVLRHYVSLAYKRSGKSANMSCQWNFSVTLLPKWLAPNMVTLIGFGFVLANVGLLEIYVPDLVGPVSSSMFRGLPSNR